MNPVSVTPVPSAKASRRSVLTYMAALGIAPLSMSALGKGPTTTQLQTEQFFALPVDGFQRLVGSAFEFWNVRDNGSMANSARALLTDVQQERVAARGAVALESIRLRFTLIEQSGDAPDGLCQVQHVEHGRFEAFVQQSVRTDLGRKGNTELVVSLTRFA
jgi:hypothetical protein